VDVFSYDFSSGARSRFQLSDIDEDDHNAPGLMILPNGKYLAMYSNHGNTSLGDYLSRYRISTNPHDSSSWTAEQSFNWQTVTGWNVAPNPNNRVSYHNLFYLPADDGGNGRIYDFSRGTHQSANALLFDQSSNTWTWGGQLTTSSSGGYSTGYVKYASNGTDKIYFISTETHPRNFNNNLWSGYVSDGKTYDMLGNVIDGNLFNNEDTAGVGAVPDINLFTNIRLADGNSLESPNANPNANGVGVHRLWTVDMSLDENQNPVAMYIARDDPNATNPGNDTNIDHRIYYARWNGTEWTNHELARMGERLYNSEEDYTGNGALVPGDPNTVYISTQYDPRDATGATTTTRREIYKGVTPDGGANWNWSAITSGSSVDNLRPIVPAWDADHTALVWFRGTYSSAQNTDTAVVGIIDQHDTQSSLVHYVDATNLNTTRSTGAAIGATGPSNAEGGPTEVGAGAGDNNWHWRTGVGNGNGGAGDVLAVGATDAESTAPALKTTLTGLADGSYDIFGYFWANQTNDWRIQFGLDAANMQLYRDNGAQQAELAQFDDAVTLASGGAFLYRAYLGRASVMEGSSVDVFVDDFGSTGTTGANRTWYDGVGYALISEVIEKLAGDFNNDMSVDAADYVVWRDNFGAADDLLINDNGDGIPGIDQGDYAVWKSNFGTSSSPGGSGQSVPEPTTGCLFGFASVLVWLSRARRFSRVHRVAA
jgi:hypothetical protein